MSRTKRISLASLLVLMSLIFSSLILQPQYCYADEENSGAIEYSSLNEEHIRSIQKDFFTSTFKKKIVNGEDLMSLFDGSEKDRKELNYKLYNGEEVQKHSLYDRFGGSVSVPLYTGEDKISTGAADKIYNAAMMGLERDFKFDELIDLVMLSDTFYTNRYYKDRPILKSSDSDPRTKEYKPLGPISGASLGVANYNFTISELITSVTSFIAGDGAVSIFSEQMESLSSTKGYELFSGILKGVFPLLIALFLVFIAIKTYKCFIGNSAKTAIVQASISVVVSLSLFWAAIDNPNAFISLSKNILTFGEQLQSVAISKSFEGDEIVESDSLDNVLSAALWKTSVFEPWVSAVFNGARYDELYTAYSEKGSAWEPDKEASKQYGDISVYRSSDPKDDVKNWAALAYSCSSIYHIDSIRAEDGVSKPIESSDGKNDSAKENWPKATLVGSSDYIYSDDFRWLDAFAKVGKYEDGNGGKTDDYYQANFGVTNIVNVLGQSYKSLNLSILLLPVLILGVKKTVCSLQSLGNFLIVLYRSAFNIFSPEDSEYSVLANIKAVLNPFILYFWYIITMSISIGLYNAYGSSDNPILLAVYVSVAFYLAIFDKPKQIKDHFDGSAKWLYGKAMSFKSSAMSANGALKDIYGEGISSFRHSVNNSKTARELLTRPLRKKDADEDNSSEDGYRDKLEAFIRSRGFDRIISPKTYLDADLSKTPRSVRDRYNALIRSIRSAKTNDEVWLAINKHRFDSSFDGGSSGLKDRTKNIDNDKRYLDIPPNQSADDALLGDRRYNKYHDVEKDMAYSAMISGISSRNENLNRRQRKIEDRIMAKNLYERGEIHFNKYGLVNADGYEALSEAGNKSVVTRRNTDKTRIGKDIDKLRRDRKLNLIQSRIERFTNKGMAVSIKTMIRIFAAIVLLYVAGFVMSALFG